MAENQQQQQGSDTEEPEDVQSNSSPSYLSVKFSTSLSPAMIPDTWRKGKGRLLEGISSIEGDFWKKIMEAKLL